MGHTEAARLLEQTLEEEKNTDRKLTQLAESFINDRANDESGNMGSSGSGNVVSTGSSQYANQSSSDQTYQSGQSYNGPQTGSGNATLGGTMGI